MTNHADKLNFLIERLHAKPSGNGFFMAQCPAHDDRKPSLAMGTPGGRLWVECRAGCTDKAVMDALAHRGLWPIQVGEEKPIVPPLPGTAVRPQKTDAQRTEGARAIWDAALPLDPDNPDDAACLYLQRRGIAAAIGSAEMRFHMCCIHPDGGAQYRALVCRVVDVRGRFRGVHAIYLQRDGSKILADVKKASWGPIRGGAIRFGGIAPEIVVAEGPETAMSAGILLGLPAWSGIDAGNMGRLKLPKEIRSVIIAADRDAVNPKTGRSAGISAAHTAYRRWQSECRAVRILKPKTISEDMNDILLRLAAGEAHAA